MDAENYRGHTIVYEQGPTNWGAHVEDLPICFAIAETREECERLIHEGIHVYADAIAEQAAVLHERRQRQDRQQTA
jgi:predicted RNase H-like HicB family nuclease